MRWLSSFRKRLCERKDYYGFTACGDIHVTGERLYGTRKCQATRHEAGTVVDSRCRGSSAGAQGSGAMIQAVGLLRRRSCDLACTLVTILALSLYWVKLVDWRVCSTPAMNFNDSWPGEPRWSAWAGAWPCSSNLIRKLACLWSSPVPFIRHLFWSACLSDLHFLTSFYMMLSGGLDILVVARGGKPTSYQTNRLTWAMASGAQLGAVTVLVRLLRRRLPRSESAPLEGEPLIGPIPGRLRDRALGMLMHLLLVMAAYHMYGGRWPVVASPRHVLVVLQVASGLIAVCASSLHRASPRGARSAASGLGAAEAVDVLTRSLSSATSSVVEGPWRGPRSAEPHDGADLPEEPDVCWTVKDVDVGEAATARGAMPVAPGLSSSDCRSSVGKASVVSYSAGVGCSARSGPGSGEQISGGVRQCRRLAAGADARGCGADMSLGRRRFASHEPSTQHSRRCRSRRSSTSSASGTSGAAAPGVLGLDGTSSSTSGGGSKSYGDVLTWTHVRLKLPGLDPSQLSSGVAERLARAVAAEFRDDAAVADVAVRSGCVEVHLDLVRTVAPEVAAAAAAAATSTPTTLAPEHGGPPGPGTTAAAATAAAAAAQHGPASAEQQGLASCILEALGLPPGYDAAVRAQLGPHLLTLTPAAGSGGGWAVLGTRRMLAHEVPRVTKVEPPAVVAPAAADVTRHSRSATIRMTITGSTERLSVAHEDPDLEVLALFEGAFLGLSNLQWGPLEESPYAAGHGDAAGSAAGTAGPRFARLPPSLAVSRRVLTAALALPAGRTGAVSLLLMRRGTAGQSHSLLLVRQEDRAIAAEVAALQARAHAADGPPMGSVASFTRDLGHWLQYREFWCRKAAMAACSSGVAGACGKAPSANATGRQTVRRFWMDALWSWNQRRGGVGGTGGDRSRGAMWLLQPKPQRCACVAGPSGSEQGSRGAAAAARATASAAAAAEAAGAQPQAGPTQSDESDLLDQDHAIRGTGGGTGNDGGAGLFHNAQTRNQVVSLSEEEQQRLAQGSVPAFGQPAYEKHMRVARGSLLDFALEQRCAAVAAALLQPAPVPTQSSSVASWAAMYGAASYLAELAESSRAACPDGLTLLHRAVRGGDAATVDIVLLAAARAAEAAAEPSPQQQMSPSPGQLFGGTSDGGDASGTTAAASDGSRRTTAVPNLYGWDSPDSHGITPLHYLAVLDDGGALARHVLSRREDALALWEAGSLGMPPPATFAAQNGVFIDVAGLRRQRERERVEEEEEEQRRRERERAAWSCTAGARPPGAVPLLHAALRGFPCGDVEQRYQSFARASQASALPVWLLLLLQVVAWAGGALQVACNRGMIPLVVLQSGCVLLALGRYRPSGLLHGSGWRVVAWVIQALALALMLTGSIEHALPTRAAAQTGPAVSPADPQQAREGTGAADGGGLCYSGPALRHALLTLHHVLAVVAVPRRAVPFALHQVLAVQAVEAAAAGVLLLFGRRRLGAAAAAGLPNAGLAAALVAGGSLLRCVASSLVALAVDASNRAAFLVCGIHSHRDNGDKEVDDNVGGAGRSHAGRRAPPADRAVLHAKMD